MRLVPGHDRKTRWASTGGVFFLLLGSIATVVSIVVGNPPDFSANHLYTALCYSASALISVLCLIGLYFSSIRGSYLFVVSSFGFSIAGLACGYNSKIMALLLFSSAAILLLPMLFGEKADLASETKKIKIRAPWR